MGATEHTVRTRLLREGGPLRKAMRDAAEIWGFEPAQPISVGGGAPPDYGVWLSFRERRAGEFLVDFLSKRSKLIGSPVVPTDSYRVSDDGALHWTCASEEERGHFLAVLCSAIGIQ
jgi:hypothetical protein